MVLRGRGKKKVDSNAIIRMGKWMESFIVSFIFVDLCAGQFIIATWKWGYFKLRYE